MVEVARVVVKIAKILRAGFEGSIRSEWLAISIFSFCVFAHEQQFAATTSKNPSLGARTTIRISGDRAISALLGNWEREFQRAHPEVEFENRLTGPMSAMAGLYANVSDIALVGHELLTSESMAFEWIFHYKALAIEVNSGSLDGPYFAPAFFVSSNNPLSALTLEQAASVFGCERRGGQPARTWSDLGATGEWADRPIHVYAYQTESELGVFIRRKVLKNSYKWNCDMKTFGPTSAQPNAQQDGSADVLDALRTDPYGIGVSNVRYATPDLKIVPLTNSELDQAVAPSSQSIIQQQYPLVRPFFAYINREPGKPLRTELAAFLRLVLSSDGQQHVGKDGTFLPLSDSVAREQLAKLD